MEIFHLKIKTMTYNQMEILELKTATESKCSIDGSNSKRNTAEVEVSDLV